MNIQQIIVLLILLAVVVYFFRNNKSPFENVDVSVSVNDVVSVNTESESPTNSISVNVNENIEKFQNVDDSFAFNKYENFDQVEPLDNSDNEEMYESVDNENDLVPVKSNLTENTENFENLNINNAFVYASKPQDQISNVNIPPVFGASSNEGVLPNKIALFTDVQTDANVDVLTKNVNNQQLKQSFERSFLLDPTGSISQNDISQGNFNPQCCPAQWSPTFMDTSKPLSPEYVPNNYSGNNINGSGCACITKNQANYIRTRGGNGN